MIGLGERLRLRARALDLNDSQVARRAGLDERRYHHYVRDRNEPDLETLSRICAVLEVTPSQLLGWDAMPDPTPDDRDTLLARLHDVAKTLPTATLAKAVRWLEVARGP